MYRAALASGGELELRARLERTLDTMANQVDRRTTFTLRLPLPPSVG